MKCSNQIMVLCDIEEEYAQLMTEFLKKQKDLPWNIHTYTDVDELLLKESEQSVAILVIAESVYSESLKSIQSLCTVILNESGYVKWNQVRNVNKYQQADCVLREILEVYMEVADRQLPQLQTDYKTKFVGIYSPVRRCLQTSFALTMSQMLAKEHPTLYMNFEHYAGITELLPDMQTRDMADLLYFLTAKEDKFRLRIQTIIQRKGALDYIPPMRAGQNLLTITTEEWMSLLQKIGELGQYEYIVLDLSESMQGLFDILRRCVHIFTLAQNDRIAQTKLLQYEQLLELYEYQDVLQKTSKCYLPQIRRLPEELEQYTRGDLAEYVRRQIEMLCRESNSGMADS